MYVLIARPTPEVKSSKVPEWKPLNKRESGLLPLDRLAPFVLEVHRHGTPARDQPVLIRHLSEGHYNHHGHRRPRFNDTALVPCSGVLGNKHWAVLRHRGLEFLSGGAAGGAAYITATGHSLADTAALYTHAWRWRSASGSTVREQRCQRPSATPKAQVKCAVDALQGL